MKDHHKKNERICDFFLFFLILSLVPAELVLLIIVSMGCQTIFFSSVSRAFLFFLAQERRSDKGEIEEIVFS
jgi:hypothetical protein